MNPSPQTQTTPARRPRVGHIARVTLVGAAVALFAIAPFVSSQGDDADVNVVFDADDMGFNATSTKDISNIIVEDCEGDTHKHDDLDGLYFVHREDFVIAAVYVKSGNNGIEGNQPPGAGERFVNEGACDEETSSSSSTTSDETSTTSDESSTTSDETTTTSDETSSDSEETSSDSEETSSDPGENTTEVPFFTSGTALVLGMGGALAGTMVMLRRRL